MALHAKIMSDNQVIDLLVNHQEAVFKLLQFCGVYDPLARIKQIIDHKEYEFVCWGPMGHRSIRKKSTDEVFHEGDTVWSLKYGREIRNIYFDDFLLGEYIGNEFYQNYVRASSGMYPLSEIAKCKPIPFTWSDDWKSLVRNSDGETFKIGEKVHLNDYHNVWIITDWGLPGDHKELWVELAPEEPSIMTKCKTRLANLIKIKPEIMEVGVQYKHKKLGLLANKREDGAYLIRNGKELCSYFFALHFFDAKPYLPAELIEDSCDWEKVEPEFIKKTYRMITDCSGSVSFRCVETKVEFYIGSKVVVTTTGKVKSGFELVIASFYIPNGIIVGATFDNVYVYAFDEKTGNAINESLDYFEIAK